MPIILRRMSMSVEGCIGFLMVPVFVVFVEINRKCRNTGFHRINQIHGFTEVIGRLGDWGKQIT